MRARLQTLVDKLFDPSVAGHELRRAAFDRVVALTEGVRADAANLERLPAALAAWVERVARGAWEIGDEDVARLRAAGIDEDTIFETTVAAAVGAGIARYRIAARAIEAAAATATATAKGG
ncbi:MAG TPA: hypothetical protein VGL86_10430 [Polyangia bacterium]|jgi:alkylhydroperoxidase family enzyme